MDIDTWQKTLGTLPSSESKTFSILPKVLFFTDSLGLPRSPDVVSEEDTWPSQVSWELQRKFRFFFQLYGGADTKLLLKLRTTSYTRGFRPAILVLQVGIVDCAPRVFSRLEVSLFKATKLSFLARKFAHKYHAPLTKLRRMTYVSPTNFQQNLQKLKALFADVYCLAVPIAPPNQAYIAHSPNIARNVNQYNGILYEVFGDGFIYEAYENTDIEALLDDDNHHLSKYGHQILGKRIIKRLEQLSLPSEE